MPDLRGSPVCATRGFLDIGEYIKFSYRDHSETATDLSSATDKERTTYRRLPKDDEMWQKKPVCLHNRHICGWQNTETLAPRLNISAMKKQINKRKRLVEVHTLGRM